MSKKISWKEIDFRNIATEGRIALLDTRDTPIPPSINESAAFFDLKSNSIDGLNDGGNFHAVVTVSQWADNTGGGVRQIAFTDNDNMWIRGSGSDKVSYGPWRRIKKEYLGCNHYNVYFTFGSGSTSYLSFAGSDSVLQVVPYDGLSHTPITRIRMGLSGSNLYSTRTATIYVKERTTGNILATYEKTSNDYEDIELTLTGNFSLNPDMIEIHGYSYATNRYGRIHYVLFSHDGSEITI